MPKLAFVLPALGLALVASTGLAQPVTGASCPYESCAVRLQTAFFGEHLLRGDSGEKVLKVNFTGGNVADYLSRVESARVPAQQFQARRTRAAVLGIISGIAAGYAYGALASDDGLEDDPGADVFAALAISIPTAIWGAVEATRSRNAVSRAIWEFNRSPVR